jgi:hypothetical protein
MARSRNGRRREDHTDMAFVIAGIFACLVVAVIEDVSQSATSSSTARVWHVHPVSVFVGTLTFIGLLYFLQRMNDRKHALLYLEPYALLLVLSGANLAVKVNSAWLLPVVAISIAWSVLQVRRLRDRRSALHRSSDEK